jgi:NTE family protein
MQGEWEMQQADLVLEGGGVKGIARIGAIAALVEAVYGFPRAAAASAGAIAAAFTAARTPPGRLHELMTSDLDYRRVPLADWLGRVPLAGAPFAIVLERGVFTGDYLRDRIRQTLREGTGVERWGHLRAEDAEDARVRTPCANDLERPRRALAVQGGGSST